MIMSVIAAEVLVAECDCYIFHYIQKEHFHEATSPVDLRNISHCIACNINSYCSNVNC